MEAQIQAGLRGSNLKFEDISSIAIGGSLASQDKVVAIIQTSRSISESEMAGSTTKRTEKAGEYTIYHEPAGAAVRVDDRTLMGGNAEMIKAVLAREGPARLSQQLQTALGEVDFSSSIAGAAVLAGLPMPPMAAPGAPVDPKQIESVALSIDLGSSIDVAAAAFFDNDNTASTLQAKIDQQMSMMRQMMANLPPQMAPVKDILDSLRVGRSGRKITASVRIPQSVIDQIPMGMGRPMPNAGAFPTSPNQSPSGAPSRRRPSGRDPNLPPTAPSRGLF
jgi:hypothetical protein